jgi:transposase
MNNNVIQTPRLSEAEKGMIIGYNLSGYTVREISQILRRTKATVYKWVTRFRNEGNAGLKVRNRSGRIVAAGNGTTFFYFVCSLDLNFPFY